MLTLFLRAAGCDDQLADEVWQETMVVAWKRLDSFDRRLPFGPWLRGIASKTLLSKRREQNRLLLMGDPEVLLYLSDQTERVTRLPGDTLDDKLDALRECISRLPDHDRECIQLRFHEDLKPTAISERVGVTLEAIKKRLLRAKARLQKCIQEKLNDLSDLQTVPQPSALRKAAKP